MNSMTGYGKATRSADGLELTVELKSVNHRFLDISTKMPRAFIAYDDVIRSVIGAGVSRGHVDVFINLSEDADREKSVSADFGLAKGYVDVAASLAERFGLKNDFQVNSLMKSPDVVKVEQREESDETLRVLLTEALGEAVQNLNSMRRIEGEKLRRDISLRIDKIEDLLKQISLLAPEVVLQYRNKLSARISEALEGVEVDQARFLNEIAFFTDKTNIDEEITRLGSHVDGARKILALDEPVGRKLDFLVQEFNREANTICSKSNYVALTNVALDMKNEIEKVREQVQNLE